MPEQAPRCRPSQLFAIAPALVGVALFGLTLNYAEITRVILVSGSRNTRPLEIWGMTTNVTSTVLYALGTLTTLFSLCLVGMVILTVSIMRRRRAAHGSDAGNGMV